MVYTVFFKPTKEHYKALQKLGSALERSEYPVVSRSGFRSPEADCGLDAAGVTDRVHRSSAPGWRSRNSRKPVTRLS